MRDEFVARLFEELTYVGQSNAKLREQVTRLQEEQQYNFEKWFGIVGGVGLTGVQPECATVMDHLMEELVTLRRQMAELQERANGIA